jgi:hypothetical protein
MDFGRTTVIRDIVGFAVLRLGVQLFRYGSIEYGK